MGHILTDLALAKVAFRQRTILAVLAQRETTCPTCTGTGRIDHKGHGTVKDSACPDCKGGDAP